MRLEPTDTRQLVARLRRANGHLASVIRMLEDGAECEDVLTQLAAVHKAIGRSAYSLITTGMTACFKAAADPSEVDTQRMERLFRSFA